MPPFLGPRDHCKALVASIPAFSKIPVARTINPTPHILYWSLMLQKSPLHACFRGNHVAQLSVRMYRRGRDENDELNPFHPLRKHSTLWSAFATDPLAITMYLLSYKRYFRCLRRILSAVIVLDGKDYRERNLKQKGVKSRDEWLYVCSLSLLKLFELHGGPSCHILFPTCTVKG